MGFMRQLSDNGSCQTIRPGNELVHTRGSVGTNTPKAFANFSPVVGAQRQHWDFKIKKALNPERVRHVRVNPFRVNGSLVDCSQGLSLRSNHWAVISERLRRIGIIFRLINDSRRSLRSYSIL